MSGPVSGANTIFTYDAYGRRRTVTDPAGLVLNYDYDNLDRVTKVTYPDTTYEQTTYDKLDAIKRRDRLGKTTQTCWANGMLEGHSWPVIGPMLSTYSDVVVYTDRTFPRIIYL